MTEAEAVRAAIRDFDETMIMERLRLRRVEPADAEALHALFADWDVVRWLARPRFPVALAATRAYCDGAATRAAVDGELDLAIVGDDGPMGVITWRLAGSSPVQRETGSSLGYWLGRRFWGRGIMTAAATALVRRIFTVPEVTTVYSGVFDGNGASLAIQRKLGFVEDGRAMVWCNPHRDERLHINTRLTRRGHATDEA